MSPPHGRGCTAVGAAVAALTSLGACSSGTASPGVPSNGAASTVGGEARRWTPVGPASAADLASALVVVSDRLTRLGVADAGVRIVGGGLSAAATIDPVVNEAVGRREATALWTVAATAVGPCRAAGEGAPSLPVGRRCHRLGARIAGVEAVRSAQARLEPGVGWSVELFVDPAGYAALRQALSSVAATPVAAVADGQVVAVFDASGALGQHDRIGPGLTEREARRLAAALAVHDSSPVAFRPPTLAPEPGPYADKDFWLAALSANVCGAWLTDAPATPDASGIHSHGDGLVYAHPFGPEDAEVNATLGRWLGHGAWSAAAGTLALWDGASHRTGDACPDGRAGAVRWWVDGVEQQGDPGRHRIGNGEAVTLSFNPVDVDPGPPPAAARLPRPRLTPEA